MGQRASLMKTQEENFKEKHLDCSLKCANCKSTFPDLTLFNEHLMKCVSVDEIPSIQEKLNHVRDDLQPSLRFMAKTGKRRPCSNCGEFILENRSSSSHKCNQIPECHFCHTQVPAKYLMHHVQQCQILAEAKLMLINLERTERTSKSQASQPETSQPKPSQPEPSQPEASQPEASQPEASQPEANEPEASEPESSQPEVIRDLKNDVISSQESNTSKISSSSSDSKQKISSSSDEVSKTYSENRLKYIRKTRKRSFGQGLDQILEEDRNSVNESKRPCLRSQSKLSNDPVLPDSSLDDGNAEILKKRLRKSNEYKHLTDITGFIKFFKQAANQSEKRLLLAALLPDKITADDVTHFSSLLNVKKDYIEDVHRQRLLKVALGHNYPIESERKNKGQVRVSPEIKSKIIKDIDDAAQYWPGVAELIHLKCSSVTDDSLKSFYTTKANIVPKRSVDHYQMSRKVLPVRFIDYYNEEIKSQYSAVSFHQFMSLVPYHVFPVNIGWSHS